MAKNKQKVCIMTHRHPLEIGGIQTFNRNLMEMFDIDCYYYIDSALKLNEDEKANKNIFKIGNLTGKISIINYILNCRKVIKNYDTIIINFPFMLLFIPQKILKGKKVIVVQHSSFARITKEPFYMLPYIDKAIIANLQKKTSKLILLSEYEQELKELNIPSTVIRHTSKIPRAKEIRQPKKNIVMLTRHSKEKRVDIAIEVMKHLPDYSLNIYGAGPLKNENKLLAKNVNNVIINDSTSQVEKVLDESSFALMVSDAEGYPISNIEAMRRGLVMLVRNTFNAANEFADLGAVTFDTKQPEEIAQGIKDAFVDYEKIAQTSLANSRVYDFENIKEKWEHEIYSK